ncbi:MAG: hypothetical protein ACP5RH_01110 [Leptodesmis sp.]|uniref:hypothetical protein n=1 Tax=Leptodesmis sp. TaxID=3100501 RepID=UPI003D125097
MIEIEAEFLGVEELLQALGDLASDETVRSALRAAIPNLGRINKAQMDVVAQLPYALSYIGKKKPSGKRVAGGSGDQGWGRDTLSLQSDLLFSWDLDALALTNFSDLVYAGRIAKLAEDKGASLFGEDDAYLAVVEQELGDRVEQIWHE